MKLRDYIKDQIISIFIYILFLGILIFLLLGFQVNQSLFIAIVLLVFLYGIYLLLYPYYRKKKYYDLVMNQLKELDKKYLLHSLLYEPHFLDGKILFETLYETDKDMREHIITYEQKLEELKEYIELWIHEVKIPIAAGLLCLHNHPTKESSKLIDQFHKIDAYVEQVLYYARSEHPEKDYLISKVSVKQVVNQVAIKNKDSFIEHKIKLELYHLDKIVYTDSKWLEYLLNQLIQNSIQYRKAQNSKIVIEAVETERCVTISMKDNGIGISKSDLPRVFEKGFTGTNGRMKKKSTGMGLYLCKKLCDKLGHKLSIQSEEGEYTEVTIEFGKHDFYDVTKEK